MSENNLTKVQNEIVTAPLGPALVTAGAGSGKTRVLTNRITYLIESKIFKQSDILALTFTNKAAEEMKSRIHKMLGVPCEVFAGTFHSFCARFLRKNIEKLNTGYNRDFSIYNTSDSQKVIKEILANNSFDELNKDSVKIIEWNISNMKNLGLSSENYRNEILHLNSADEIIRAINAYDGKLQSANALDFDDLLIKTLEIFDKCPEVLAQIQQRFKYILVDEFQDTNLVQYKIAHALAREHKNIMVVGDEDQCIYTWRGASIKNIQLFQKDFAGARIYKLEENFRSSKNIVELANKLVEHNNNRIKKVLFSSREDGVINFEQYYNDKEEAQRIAEIIASSGRKYSDFAVLMRINALSRVFEEQFLAYNIPHTVWGGFKFYERAEIKSVINYLRVLVNPRDEVALLDIVNWPRRGVGDSSVEKVRALGNPYEVIMNIDKYSEHFTKKTLSGIKNFVHVFNTLNEINTSFGLFELAGNLISTIGLEAAFDKKKEEDMNRLENIYQLEKAVKDFANDNPGAVLGQWLQSVSLVSTDDTAPGGDAVVISTVHSAKGLEFKTVFVVGLEDGLFPLARAKNSEAELEEERRLLYVAITRAREQLYLSYCGVRFLHGESRACLPSLFLKQCGVKAAKPFANETEYTSNYGERYGRNARDYNSRFSSYKTGAYQNTDSYNTAFKQNFAAEQNIPAKTDTAESLGFEPGQRVRHEKFGEGTVTQIIDKNIVKIQFDIAGIKMLSLAFAALTKI